MHTDHTASTPPSRPVIIGRLRDRLTIHHLSLMMVVILVMGGTLINLNDYPHSWLDEGFSLNAAVTLAETGQYGTFHSDGILLFDPAISTGAPVIAPLALSISLFGPGLAQARLVIVMFTVLSAVSLYILTNRLYGFRPTIFALLFVLAFPVIDDSGLLYKGRQVLGEVPAFLFLLAAVILWKRDWSHKYWLYAVAAGLALGLALLTKLQVALPFLPAMLYIAVLRVHQRQGNIIRLMLPMVVAVAVYGAWLVLTQALTPAAVQAENRLVMIDGIRTNFFTDLMGSTLSRSMYAILAVILVGLGFWFWRAYTADKHPTTEESDARWGEAVLVAYVAFSVVWIYIFSIGWPRYIFGGFVISLLLVGRGLYHLLMYTIERLNPADTEQVQTRAYVLALAAMMVIGFMLHVMPSVFHDNPGHDDAIIAYIDQHVERNAVVESWEWDIISRGQHRQYHMPHQLLLQRTLRQFSHQDDFDIPYDVLQADPDYLLIGPFAAWVGIYNTPAQADHFVTEAQFGPYHLLRRVEAVEAQARPERTPTT